MFYYFVTVAHQQQQRRMLNCYEIRKEINEHSSLKRLIGQIQNEWHNFKVSFRNGTASGVYQRFGSKWESVRKRAIKGAFM